MSLIAFRKLHDSIEFMIDAFIVAHVDVNVNLKNVDSMQSLFRIFEYKINKRLICATHIYECIDRLLVSVVATSLC